MIVRKTVRYYMPLQNYINREMYPDFEVDIMNNLLYRVKKRRKTWGIFPKEVKERERVGKICFTRQGYTIQLEDYQYEDDVSAVASRYVKKTGMSITFEVIERPEI
jgi:hypothetical protein